MDNEKVYWLMERGVRIGPLSYGELVRRLSSPGQPVWREGLPDWIAAEGLPELSGFFRVTPPIPQPQAVPRVAPQQPIAPVSRSQQTMPPTYLAWSIIAMLICCLPTGIVALIYSVKVSSRWSMGDYEGSLRASDTAMWWIIITVVCGLIALPFQFVLALL